MEDTLSCDIDISTLVSAYSDDCTILQVYSDKKLEKEWHLLEEDDDHIFLKNNNNEVLFIKKGKK